MDFTNYIYMTWFYFYLGKECSISVTRSIDSILPASLSEVNQYCEQIVLKYTNADEDFAPEIIGAGLASMLPTTVGSVTGFQAMGFREGALNPVVFRSDRLINGGLSNNAEQQLPSFVAANYYAPTNTYRRKGTRFGWPVVSENWVNGQSLNGTYNDTFAGRTALTGPGLLTTLNNRVYWDIVGQDYITFRSVVKRVPNLKPDGSVEGDRLPSFINDPVSAVICSTYDYDQRVKTRNGRKLK